MTLTKKLGADFCEIIAKIVPLSAACDVGDQAVGKPITTNFTKIQFLTH